MPTNYFEEAVCLVQDQDSNTPLPFRTFTAGSRTAIHLNREPFLRRKSIGDITSMFGIPDLTPSLAHFLSRVASGTRSLYMVGGRRPPMAGPLSLPFEKLDVWSGLRLQMKDYHDPRKVHPPQTQCAWPPSELWPLGCYDTVLINTDPDEKWPYSKMSGNNPSPTVFTLLTADLLLGHCVVQIRLIFRVIHPAGSAAPPDPDSPLNSFLAYVQRFDIVPQASGSGSAASQGPCRKPSTNLYMLKCSCRADGTRMGDIIPLSHIHAAVDLVPQFMEAADSRLTKESSLEYSSEFILNDYFNRQLYYALLET
jgi:hypothetical protein